MLAILYTIYMNMSSGLLITIMHQMSSIRTLQFLLITQQMVNNIEPLNNKVKNNYAIENKRDLKGEKIISILQDDIILDDKIVLEIGSGYGHITQNIGKITKQIMGIEISHDLVNIAKNKHAKCDFIQGNGAMLPVRNKCIDVIILNHVIEHTKYQQEMIEECKRVLNKNGIIYIATPNKHFPIEPHTKIPFFGYMGNKIQTKYEIYNLTKKELIDLFEHSGFCHKYRSIHIIYNIVEFPEYNRLMYRVASRVLRYGSFFPLPDFLIPTHIFTLILPD